jgi:peptidoglycan/xylan/chitin deacetylase (PgdA/CDA1 family)
MDLSPGAFSAQLDWMSDHGEIVSLDEALRRIGTPEGDKCYVLTFDDGHESLYRVAFPILAQRGIPFTLYVTTAPLEADLLLHGNPSFRLASWEEIRTMRESGLMTIGAHGHEHLDARAHDRDTLENDLRACNQLLRARLEVDPDHFAYPWGHASSEADRPVRSFYRTAAIGGGGALRRATDRHRLPRIPVMSSDHSLFVFSRKTWGGFRLERGLRSLRDQMTSP